MEKLKIQLNEAILNEMNPRSITDIKLQKLITSILVLPKMLEMRPVVVDDNMIVLGGNMRLRALRAIADMSEDDVKHTLNNAKDYNKKTQAEKDLLLDYWLTWKDKPIIEVIKASMLSAEEQKQFIIKDNVGFGAWDFDMLANEWDAAQLTSWGVDLPIMESEINVNEFFDFLDNEDEKSKSEKLTITIPDEYADQKDEIKTLIETALTEYKGVKIK
mgnify:CR=1 FL=1